MTTAGGTATAGADYVGDGQPTLVTFAPGETEQVITIQTIDDNVREADETLVVTLANPSSNAELGTVTSATVTLADNDLHGSSSDSAQQLQFDEGNSGGVVNGQSGDSGQSVNGLLPSQSDARLALEFADALNEGEVDSGFVFGEDVFGSGGAQGFGDVII